MKIKRLLAAALVAAGLVFSPLAKGKPHESLIKESTVLILSAPDKEGRVAQCSGTVIHPGMVLTAKHCLALSREELRGETEFTRTGNATFNVRDARGKWHYMYGSEAFHTRAHPAADAAIIFVPSIECPCAPVASSILESGDVRAVGFGSGKWVDDTGMFSQILELDGPGDWAIQHFAFTWFGMSGGGLWQEQDGKWYLIGVHSRLGIMPFMIISFAVPVTKLGEILDR